MSEQLPSDAWQGYDLFIKNAYSDKKPLEGFPQATVVQMQGEDVSKEFEERFKRKPETLGEVALLIASEPPGTFDTEVAKGSQGRQWVTIDTRENLNQLFVGIGPNTQPQAVNFIEFGTVKLVGLEGDQTGASALGYDSGSVCTLENCRLEFLSAVYLGTLALEGDTTIKEARIRDVGMIQNDHKISKTVPG